MVDVEQTLSASETRPQCPAAVSAPATPSATAVNPTNDVITAAAKRLRLPTARHTATESRTPTTRAAYPTSDAAELSRSEGESFGTGNPPIDNAAAASATQQPNAPTNASTTTGHRRDT